MIELMYIVGRFTIRLARVAFGVGIVLCAVGCINVFLEVIERPLNHMTIKELVGYLLWAGVLLGFSILLCVWAWKAAFGPAPK